MWKLLIGLPRLATVIVTVMFARVESNVTVALPKPGVVVGGVSWDAVRNAPSVCPNATDAVREMIVRAMMMGIRRILSSSRKIKISYRGVLKPATWISRLGECTPQAHWHSQRALHHNATERWRQIALTELIPHSHPHRAGGSERDDRRGAHFDAAIGGVFDRYRRVEPRGDRVRGEEIDDSETTERKLTQIVVELHRRPAGLHAGAAARRGKGELQRGRVARHLRQTFAGQIAGRHAGIAEKVSGGEAPLPGQALLGIELHAARAAAAEVPALARDERGGR